MAFFCIRCVMLFADLKDAGADSLMLGALPRGICCRRCYREILTPAAPTRAARPVTAGRGTGAASLPGQEGGSSWRAHARATENPNDPLQARAAAHVSPRRAPRTVHGKDLPLPPLHRAVPCRARSAAQARGPPGRPRGVTAATVSASRRLAPSLARSCRCGSRG